MTPILVRPAALIIVLAGVLSLSACPFSSDLPLGLPADASLDGALTGTWQAQDPESQQWVSITFVPFNEREYVALTHDPGEKEEKEKLWRVFVTLIDEERFLNIEELDGGNDAAWSFANYRVSGDTLSIRLLDDALFSSQTFRSSDALRDYVRAHLHDPRLYMSDDGKESVMSWRRAAS